VDDAGDSRELAVLLVHVAEQLKSDFAEAVEGFGLSVPAARTLLLLDEPAPMGVLSERLACDKSYITRIADELENRGLVQRMPGADRRVQMLSPTRTGARMRDDIYAAVTANNRVHLSLSRTDRVALRKALEHLVAD
jgi:DNA-binding MarR family transcriptional regulator